VNALQSERWGGFDCGLFGQSGFVEAVNVRSAWVLVADKLDIALAVPIELGFAGERKAIVRQISHALSLPFNVAEF